MQIELRPLGVNCNIACQYCYQNNHRDAGQKSHAYDIAAMKRAIEESGATGFHLFGGEPLLLPYDALEELLDWGLTKYGHNGIQTNGVLITERHIALFAHYKVSVGLSIDGPGELNDARWAGSLDRTRAATKASEDAIVRLCAAGIFPNLMIQLTRCNGTAARLDQLCNWCRYLTTLGVRRARVHILEIDNDLVRAKYGLTNAENIEAFQQLRRVGEETGLFIEEFAEQRKMLMMRDNAGSCIWRACDPYTTEAVQGVGGHGERHNCGLTDKEGINFQKPDVQGFERYIALYHTPVEVGGCGGCRFFLVCKGQCPGTALERDWRNRSENCEVWKALYAMTERELQKEGCVPISVHPSRKSVEAAMLGEWAVGKNPSLEVLAERLGVICGSEGER